MKDISKLISHISLLSLGLLLFLSFPSVRGSDNFRCPQILDSLPRLCDRINCEKPLSKDDCPLSTIYVKNFAFCGCCPSCVRYLRPSDTEKCANENTSQEEWYPDPNCDNEAEVCPVRVNTCLPGLNCTSAGKCELPSRDEPPPHRETKECMFRKSLRQLDEVHWDPECEADGSFSPKQCKGSHYDGECFCVDREGNRIFGREWRINAENQTCACSRKTHEYRNRQGLTATFHCSSDGNFEPLQCDTDSGLCYCVDPQTGELDGAVLPEAQWKSLPCFSLNLTDQNTDGKYLRQCDSEFAGLRQLAIIGHEHGLEMQTKVLNCDFDGSYAPVQYVNTLSQCVFKNGTRIRDNSMPRNDDMTCNCARDQDEYMPSQNRSISFSCEQRTGNYEVAYDFGSYSSCVDRDGYLYGDVVRSTYFCCLMDEGCSTDIGKLCWNNVTNLEGIKPCKYWRYRY